MSSPPTPKDIQTKHFEERAAVYAEGFLHGFDETIDGFYKEAATEIIEKGYPWLYLILYKKQLGKDISATVFCSQNDFCLVFTKPTGKKITVVNEFDNPRFDPNWSIKTPSHIKQKMILKHLGLTESQTIDEPIGITSSQFFLNDSVDIRSRGETHGRNRAEMCGEVTIQYLPSVRGQVIHTARLLNFRNQYLKLENNNQQPSEARLTPQQTGHEFEKLWREGILDFYKWQPRKITIKGESNDFTAILGTQHILGETKWEKEPIDGNTMEAFAGKLAPRSHTIGWFISHSGFDGGAMSVVRRTATSGKIIVLFDKSHIDKVIVDLAPPEEVFAVELRDVYDFLYEKEQSEKDRTN